MVHLCAMLPQMVLLREKIGWDMLTHFIELRGRKLYRIEGSVHHYTNVFMLIFVPDFGAISIKAYGRCKEKHVKTNMSFMWVVSKVISGPKLPIGKLRKNIENTEKKNMHSSFLVASFYFIPESALWWLTGPIIGNAMGMPPTQIRHLQTSSDY